MDWASADARLHLAAVGPPRELPEELDDLRDAGGRERMAARLEPARRVHGQPAVRWRSRRRAWRAPPCPAARARCPRARSARTARRRRGSPPPPPARRRSRPCDRPPRAAAWVARNERQVRPVAHRDGVRPLPDPRHPHRPPAPRSARSRRRRRRSGSSGRGAADRPRAGSPSPPRASPPPGSGRRGSARRGRGSSPPPGRSPAGESPRRCIDGPRDEPGERGHGGAVALLVGIDGAADDLGHARRGQVGHLLAAHHEDRSMEARPRSPANAA